MGFAFLWLEFATTESSEECKESQQRHHHHQSAPANDRIKPTKHKQLLNSNASILKNKVSFGGALWWQSILDNSID
jgi:hypothetical protein